MIMGYGRHVGQYARLLLQFFVICVAFTGIRARYVWKTGLWRECQHYSCGRGGTQYRSVFCGEEGEYNYNSVNEENCRYLQKPKEVRECFKVCDEHHSQLRWVTTTWSKCKLNPDFKECAKNKGIQYRNVTCAWRRTGFIEDDSVCSEFAGKPPDRQQCDLKCPQDCVVSLFSKWQFCDTCKFLNKTRTRTLIVPPANDGQECPAFTEMIPCNNCTDSYTYQIGPWDECAPRDKIFRNQGVNIHPLIGFQKRNIRCLNSFGSIAGYKSCIDHVKTVYNHDELTDRQTCIIPQDCVVSQWSAWNPINTSCIRSDGTKEVGFMVRKRRVEKIPLSTGAPCPVLVQYSELEDSVKKDCPKTKWITSSWGDCETPPGSLQCTTGLQTRNTICVMEEYGHQKPTNDKFCTQSRPLTSQICRPECDLDCTVTQWTEWSECKVTDCEEYLRRRRTDEGTGQRHRTREKLMTNSGSGERCPHLDETQMCDPQPCYHWNITVERCMLLNPNVSPACGLGTAYRTLACVNKIGLRVSDSLCEELEERPDAQEDCNIPCPRDCILSPWSPWSDCPNQCQEGRTSASIRLRQRNVLAQQGPGGAPCPPNRQLEEAQPCSTTIECAICVWQTDPWGACMVLNRSNNCGEGRQNRDVNCYSLLGQLVSDQRCTLKVKPDTSQACMVPCPIDCVMTDFSDWSDCSATCWEAKQTVPVQTRLRYVLTTPRYGGKACPSKTTDVRQCTDLPICQGFFWETGVWSQCILPPLKIPQCGPGLMARDVSCKAENGTEQPLDVCISHKGPVPVVSRPCYRSCDEECTFTDWSEWSSCINGCNGKRFKTRKLIEDLRDATPNPLCQNRRLYPVDLFERCLCDAHLPITVGNWSQCILEPISEIYYKTTRSFPGLATPEPVDPRWSASLGVNPVCGPGKRYKVLACQNDRGEMEAANQCSLKPYEEETCLIPCPVDCIMSDWSPWSDCSTSCETGTQMRYRHIKQVPSDGGRLCPTLDQANKETQTRICNIDCRRYRWRVYKWSVCMPFRHERQCGNGTQSRIVRCEIFTSAGFTNEVVEEQRCYSEYKPREERNCYSPCVGECVLSEWSTWSKCSQPCTNPRQIQVRRREILRNPILIPGNRCPDLVEERLCVRGDNCIEYKWRTSEWTSCLVNQGLVECGPGHRERYAICRDHQGFIVDSSKCKEALSDSKDPLVESCEIPCDVDCLLTEWSPWTDCSSTCGIGQRTRQRAIVQEPKGNGRVCPTSFNQTRPCFQQGCYTWVVSPWSECMGEVGLCGHGVQTRNVTCVADGGLLVNMSNCAPDPSVVVTKTERNCEVPCPGECVMTDWTGWNDCFVDCKDFDQGGFIKGVQSRSRAVLAYAQGNHAPCPDKLWESRPCKATSCYSFIWHTSRWNSGKGRQVWCERSDGLEVTGGCSELSRPPDFLACNPPCSIPNSYCNDTDYCVCESHFQPVLDRLNTLIECVMDNSSAVPVSPRTVSLPEDGVTNVWMYAVIAAGTFFVIFLAVGCYTMSEYFHKGPRSRRPEERKQVEGGDNIDGMIAETSLVTCNHVAPIATANDLDNISAISVDRSSTDSVGACNGHVLAGGLTARACEEHALTEGYAHVHDVERLDPGHAERNVDIVKVNGGLQHVHVPDLDVVLCDVEAQSNTARMIPKSKSSSALRNKSDVYSVVKKDKTKHLDGSDRFMNKRFGNTYTSFDDVDKYEFKNAKKSKSDAEVAKFEKQDFDNENQDNTMQSINSHSLRNLLHSFIDKIDTLSPKNGGDGSEFSFERTVNDDVFHSNDTEMAELAPLLVDPNDSGLASAPSPKTKQEEGNSIRSDDVFCVSCGHKQSDMSDISLESFDRGSSLRSYNPSLRSERMKSLSRNSGPVIQIVPEETVANGTQTMSSTGGKTVKPLKNLFQTGLENIPKQTVIASHDGAAKIGYTTYSSVDTESSVAPSTSVSNGSLDSAADMTSDQSLVDTSPKSPEHSMDRSRNVAIDSLRNAKHGKQLKDLSPEIEDSGFGASVGFDTNDKYFKTLDNGINGKDYTDDEILDNEMHSYGHDNSADCEPFLESTNSEALGINQKPKRIGALASPNGRETNTLNAQSAFLTGAIMSKRQALSQSHGSGKLDLSE